MAEQVGHEPAVPPPAETIHMPAPSYMPVTMALGITLALVGVVVWWILTAIGLVIVVVTLFRWIGSTRREMAELPLDHGPH